MSSDRMIVFEDMIESNTGDVLHDIGVSEKELARNDLTNALIVNLNQLGVLKS